MIKDSIEEIEKRVSDACSRAGRDRSEVTLIAVSKTKPVSMINEAYEEGIRDFGENHVQELQEKMPAMKPDCRWHMIGHLQRNKCKYIVGKVKMIHSVDSLRLAEQIDSDSKKAGVISEILIEVNIARESSKFGLLNEEVLELVRDISKLSNVHINGLMTVAPYTCDAETNRAYFRGLRQLSVDIGKQNIDNVSMNVLSMGMTGDFEIAIEEGATHVRVGTGIFGGR